MPDHDDLTRWSAAAADHLRTVAQRVADAPAPTPLPEERLTFATLKDDAPGAIAALAQCIPHGEDRCVYVIDANTDVTLPELAALFAATRREQSNLRKVEVTRPNSYRLPQANCFTQLDAATRCLYVGSSCATGDRKGTLRTRLRQHLVKAPKDTYALNLTRWASEQPGGIIVRVYQYPKGTAREIVLAAEDWLSSQLQPLSGRRGSRH